MLANNYNAAIRDYGEFLSELERYVSNVLRVHISAERVDPHPSLPAYLRNGYTFFDMELNNVQLVSVLANEDAPSPATIAKNLEVIRRVVDRPVVYLASSMSSSNRGRLIEKAVSFIVPGNQMFLPEFAIDLREARSRGYSGDTVNTDALREKFSPAAQVVLFRLMMGPREDEVTPSLLAQLIDYTPMSVGRALDELESAELCMTRKVGKERRVEFRHRPPLDILDDVKNKLIKPVRRTDYVSGFPNDPELFLSGEAALSRMTNLVEPPMLSYALASQGSLKSVKERLRMEIVDVEDAEFLLETWAYNPSALSNGPLVDHLSLFAQYFDHEDERVVSAAYEVLDQVPWQ